ncbi:MAG TPA: nitronate monooxygenase family protein [Planococcus sp. (in: firmicutes)]|nr:nitronate monooxygenase family protein [Planococcus sp. (in: firmicutes)]
MISLNTRLCKLFHIDYPIVQAGMAGGPTTVALVSSVSEAGGMGTLGAAYMKPEELRKAIEEIKNLTDKPFGVNIFTAHMEDDFTRLEEVQQALNPFRSELGIKEVQSSYASPDWSSEQFNLCIELEVPVISTAFGCLNESQMKEAKRKGAKVITMVTTVAEAQAAERAGVDAVVAQGSEAGGHRGTFSLAKHSQGAQIGIMSLVPQIVDAVTVPVIAAGGIGDGRGLAASLALGASGVQVGTRFLTARESGAHRVYKEAIFNSNEESTVITKSFSGRPARGIKNLFIEEFEKTGTIPLPFPSQNTITKDIRGQAAQKGDSRFMSLWAGQNTRLLKKEERAEEIIQLIMEEAKDIFS